MTTESNNTLQIASWMIIAVLSVYIMKAGQFVLIPLAWALFLSLMILPPVQWLERKKWPRSVAILAILTVITCTLFLVLYMLSYQVLGLLRDIPAVTGKLDVWIATVQAFAERTLGVSHDTMTRQLSSSFSEMLNEYLLNLRNSLFSIFQTVTLLGVIPLYMFFMLYYRDLYYEGFARLFKKTYSRAPGILSKVNRVLQQYLTGMMIVTILMALIFYTALALLGIRYAFFFAVFLAIFNLIPYIGVILASVTVVIYALATTDSAFYPIAVLILLWLIQLIENNLISPYILGSRVKINPMIALIAIFAGASIWGISGMILFIPLAGALRAVFDELEELKPLALILGGETRKPPETQPD